ncbi:MAG TPA: DNA cytosine methyltransferase, partial [Gammaproteobacteria bacterium]|nr:DNA cytosine methyltransferase [Gammaproteobacteria bacterium]
MKTHTFTAGFLSSGIGVGADGLCAAAARLGSDTARFKNLGGVDIDPDACKDFEYLTGAPALCRDLFELQPHELRAFWGDRRPDVVFSSPPCKGFSRLLGRA